ncbi:efflux RND transporter periplasmic adaptor subunit [Alphaproteobacteria bacterium LMG 31809]|uniref:Efflux RND transporter periplasmic adaptor subunit n=1 Tax=Govanella unica TaxID=2975056 RepID=A0A9X3TZK5_9PROT|nr:efflux RND transporter periplasmic adaptor subunit [Govania unica]MDA5194362.1 efflux RND transporter periplasmic adaptor subunit [Govania unica]
MSLQDKDLLAELRLNPDTRESAPTDKRRLWISGGAAAVMALIVLGYVVFGGSTVAVDAATAEDFAAVADKTAVLEAAGYVTARREATVSAKITGRLRQVMIEEGDHVKEGEVLAKLDDTNEKAALALTQAQLAAAKSQVSSGVAQLAQAERDLNRQAELNERGFVSTQGLENARTLLATQKSQLQTLREQVRVAEAQVDVARVTYDNTIIRAPFSGVISAKAAQPGEIVSPMSAGGGFTRTGIGTIVDMDSLEIEVDVNEAYINRVEPGQPVEAVLDAYPDWKIPAAVIAIIPTADRSKATVKTRIAIKAKDPRIVPDMGVRVTFYEAGGPAESKAKAPQGVLIPGTAILQRDGKSQVFVIDHEKARARIVTAGQAYGDLRLVVSGLKSGERVVRAPSPELTDGTSVVVKDAK